MARLAGVCTGHKWPAQRPKSKQASSRWVATLPHMNLLWPACLMRHGPFLARLIFSNEKAYIYSSKFVDYTEIRIYTQMELQTHIHWRIDLLKILGGTKILGKRWSWHCLQSLCFGQALH